MAEEGEDESPHMDTDETDEEARDASLAFDDDLDSDVVDVAIEEDDRRKGNPDSLSEQLSLKI
jgi:hypothetical protein